MEWSQSETDVCPRCNDLTFFLLDEIHNLAEGCKRCGWVVDFTAEEIKVQNVSDITKFIPSMEGLDEEGQ